MDDNLARFFRNQRRRCRYAADRAAEKVAAARQAPYAEPLTNREADGRPERIYMDTHAVSLAHGRTSRLDELDREPQE